MKPPAVTVTPGKSIGLPKLEGAPTAVIEKVGIYVVQQPVPVPDGAPLAVQGWAVDSKNKTVGGGVDVLIDGMPYQAQYGGARADVADFLKSAGYKDSGFSLTIPPSKFDKGRHQVSIRLLTKDGKGFYEGPTVQFEAR